MADTKISALSAAAAAVGAQEVPCNDSGTTKKVTVAQIATLLADPSADDGDSLGIGSKRWSDLFLASGGVIDFANGDMKLTHATGKTTVSGGSIQFAAVTTTIAPILMQAGTLMTTPSDGAIEMDADCLYGCTDAGNRGVIPIEHYIRLDSNRAAFANNTNQQAIFTTPTNGRLTLETGVYTFELLLAVTAMSGTTGNGKVSLIGAGTATLGTILWIGDGWDGTSEQTAFSSGGGWHNIATQTVANVVTTQTATEMCVFCKGTFEVTVAGTIIPSFALTTAVGTAIAQAGSYFTCKRIGSTSMTSVGQWD